jgi:hypothetical protein
VVTSPKMHQDPSFCAVALNCGCWKEPGCQGPLQLLRNLASLFVSVLTSVYLGTSGTKAGLTEPFPLTHGGGGEPTCHQSFLRIGSFDIPHSLTFSTPLLPLPALPGTPVSPPAPMAARHLSAEHQTLANRVQAFPSSQPESSLPYN